MTDVTQHGQRIMADIAARHGLSVGAVEHMARAVARGGGTMAQFDVPELGGPGQWMAGGMTMVGDMFNHGLVARVDGLCAELSSAMGAGAFFAKPQTLSGPAWWPDGLGTPAATGGQGALRYAYFPETSRIAVDRGDGTGVVLLNTLDHRIGGFAQQNQGMGGDLLAGVTFSSQHGQFALSSLPRVGGAPIPEPTPPAPDTSAPPPPRPSSSSSSPSETPARAPETTTSSAAAPTMASDQILTTIERLAALRDAGALTDAEFSAKKAELLSRL